MKKNNHHVAWVEIDLNALRKNYNAIKRLSKANFIRKIGHRVNKSPEALAVIKADAYGHGMLKTASTLLRLGVNFFGVSDVNEGILLRTNGVKIPVLLFESTMPSSAKSIVEYNLTPTVCTLDMAGALNACAKKAGKKINVHVLVDTGMGRLGVWHASARDFVLKVMRHPFLKVEGIYTHFPVADTNSGFTRNQIKQLYDLVTGMNHAAEIVPYIHAANSMGLATVKTSILNLSRPGLMLYGLYPSDNLRRKIKLFPVMSVKTRVIYLKTVSKGTGISYGHTYIAKRNMAIATLPIGYNDGYFRSFSNKACVLIGGKKCRVAGRVTMDQIMVDVSGVKNVKIGTEAVVLGSQKKAAVSADELAKIAGTINYEVVCSLGNRLPRVYKG